MQINIDKKKCLLFLYYIDCNGIKFESLSTYLCK